MAKQRKRGVRLDPAVAEKIRYLAIATDWAPAQIYHAVKDEYDSAITPTLRTVQLIVKEERASPDTSGLWRLSDAVDPEDARLILDALAAFIDEPPIVMLRETVIHKPPIGAVEETHAVRHWTPRFTKAEAEWLVILRKLAPDMPLEGVWALSKLYVARGDDDTTDLDMFVALAPWRDLKRYEGLIAEGRVTPAPFWQWMLAQDGWVP